MHFSNMIFAIAATASFASAATQPKANEYKSGDCSGGINYGHNNFDLNSVTMDDSTNSVYLTTGRNSDNTPRAGWYAYTGHEIDDQGLCTGSGLGRLPDGCINLNGDSRGRIRCVRDL